jgi:arylsulfatase A-like enzyme
VAASALAAGGVTSSTHAQPQQPVQASGKRPNIVFIMGDCIDWLNIGAYHHSPNIDRLATEGMRFTDYYAEANCTAGHANFITGELP